MHVGIRTIGAFRPALIKATVLIFSLLPLPAAQDSIVCQSCHPREVQLHFQTAHAHSMQPVLTSDFTRHLPVVPIGEARGGFLYFYSKTLDALTVRAENNTTFANGIIHWVLGAGKQGQTPIVERGGQFFEHRISYYAEWGRYDLTMGHQPGISPTPEAALGRLLTRDELSRCFSCHSTEMDRNLQPRVPGVQCARCHPGATEHAAGKGLPLNPGKLNSLQQVTFCGGCHRLQAPDGDTNDPINVRFQPLRLMQSKCFRSGQLSCVLCHSAHHDARRSDPAFYDAKCLSCHANISFQRGAHASGSCIGCHMPRSNPQPHLTFTDHRIQMSTNR